MVVGILSTVFGLAGGIVMVPGLTVVGISHLEAMASSIGANIILTSWNTFMYSCKGMVRWSVVFWIAFGAALFSYTAARIAPHLPESWLILFMMVFLFYVAIRSLVMKDLKPRSSEKRAARLIPFGIGAASGTVAGFTGIGGGGITTPLMLVSGLVENQTAAPTANAVMIFTSLAGTLSYAFHGVTHFPRIGLIHADYSLLMAMGSILSSLVGMRINRSISLHSRKLVIGIILIFVTIRLGYELWW
jgi:uncharacterized membrane protein YfcA